MLTRNSKLINKKFIQYLIPSILMMLAMQFGSLLDGIIVGNMLGAEALGATALVSPITYIIQMPGFALGVGGSIIIGVYLGKRDLVKANKIFSATIIYAILISSIFAVLGIFISKPLALIFFDSINTSSIEYAYEFIFIYMITDPIISLALVIGSFMAVDNNPRLSSIYYISANIIKIVLMVLFIKGFNMGMYGAALSTAGGYFISMVCFIFYVRSKSRQLKFTFKIKNTLKDMKECIKASSVSAINLILTAIQMFIVNYFFAKWIVADEDLLVFGVIANMVYFFDLIIAGIVGLLPTLCSILNGEKDYYSLKLVVRRIYLITISMTALITIFILVFPQFYAKILGYEADNMDYANKIIRIYVTSFIPYEINKFSMNYYPSIEKNKPALITVFLREAIIVIPLSLILLKTNGILGYAMAQAFNELFTVLILYIAILLYNLKNKKYKSIFLFESLDFINLDFTLDNKLENASIASEEIAKFCKDNSISNRESQVAALAVEEMVTNIINYGYKNNRENYIDINLKLSNDLLLLRIRDDGLPFDPTKYEFDESKDYLTSGIKLIESMTDKMTYMRILNMNNTTFEIKLGGH